MLPICGRFEDMIFYGILLAVLSGVCNGLFTTPMKLASPWKWENIWLVFILTSCWVMPVAMTLAATPAFAATLRAAPGTAVAAAASFGFVWGFGAICFGRSVDRLGISIANSLVIGLSSALGSLVPMLMQETVRVGAKELVLFAGVLTFLGGVALCGKGGLLRDEKLHSSAERPLSGYVFAVISGVISAIFNIGYTLALPIATAGESLGQSAFAATNCIWLLMLGAGAIPNLFYCSSLLRKNRTAVLFSGGRAWRPLGLCVAMGLLWGGSIFLYGAATPRLGGLGPSIGWPLSLAVGLLVANLMGVRFGEWRGALPAAWRYMKFGILLILIAILLCSLSTRISA